MRLPNSCRPASRPAPAEYPPTIYVSMVRDPPTAKKIEANRKELTRRGTPVEVIQVGAVLLGAVPVGAAPVRAADACTDLAAGLVK